MALIALGVTGGIGAYKAIEIARGLQQRGHEVAAIMTRSARRFVGPVTFEAITRRRVITDQYATGANADIEHIQLATDIGLLVVAPATANVIGKFAHGIADDFLSSLYLATRAPVLMAPAMNTHMLEHDAVRGNLETLRRRGVRFVDPGEGYLACGWVGKGRLAEPNDVVNAADAILAPAGSLLGTFVLVTAGPTYEDIDAVRYLGNRSSGKMGFAIAAEAARRGARVRLIAGPSSQPPPPNVEVLRVRSAAEMHGAVMQHVTSTDAPDVLDVLIMAAAVADYAPRHRENGKISKSDGPLSLELVRTPDILADVGRARAGSNRPVLVGFAAESGDPVGRARTKLMTKQVDMIVANDISRSDAGFDADSNAVTIVTSGGDELVPLAPKSHVAATILDRVEKILSWTPAN
ncbi:MAG TPA: bifunctional phosphopantothenoylcysteine decarboxylase/phosphopantothenate--cysteine ligase CoaBC [Vicinamibacterales bacterium]|nr:bifunctional phosphopantothenoylcysteine decarboxylase/phosphopantothenate--cysteine ligase CoaBC [Vicinamibacterales bacterium]